MGILGTKADLGCDLNLLLQFTIIGVLIVGFRFGRMKTTGSISKHREVMTAALFLNFAGLVLVMAPSLLSFLTAFPVEYLSEWGLTSMPHATLGGITLFIGAIFVAKRLPKINLRRSMRTTFILWLANAGFGIALYMQMAGFI